jgi:hypothetical protein
MSEVEAVTEPSSEVKEAYVNLQVSLGAFMEAMQAASAVGIDVQAAMAQIMRASMGEAFDQLPPAVRMLLG